MSFSKSISSKKTVCVVDFGAETVACLIGFKNENQEFEILGSANGRAKGVTGGEITHLADAVEAVVAPFKKASAAAGLRPETVYYALDDAQMQASFVSGSKALSGDGEIDFADVRQASENALRMAGDFERKIVYSKPVSFTIDDQDKVADPIGIFGKKLEAQLLILQARSSQYEAWAKIMERAGIEKSVPVLSAWATACGIFSKERRREGAVAVDLGKDFINAFEVGNHRIRSYQVFLTQESGIEDSAAKKIAAFFKDKRSEEEIWITGDLAENPGAAAALESATGRTLRLAKPAGVAGLTDARYATLAGLLSVADESEKTPVLHKDKGLFASVKEKATFFLSEYF